MEIGGSFTRVEEIGSRLARNNGVRKEIYMERLDQELQSFSETAMDLPLLYRMNDAPNSYVGRFVDLSDSTVRMYCKKNMPLGFRLHISVAFPGAKDASDLNISTDVVSKQRCVFHSAEGYLYELRICKGIRDVYRSERATSL